MTVAAYHRKIPEGARHVYAAPRGVEAYHVVRLMAARGTRAVVVVSGMRPVGIVTAGDLADRLPDGGLSESLTKVEEAMSSPVIKINLRGTIADAIAMMNQKGVSHLPIVSEGGYLVSLITLDEAQRLHSEGVTGLEAFARGSVVMPISRRNLWRRIVHAIRNGIRENRLWWLGALALALAGAVLALAIGGNWNRIQTYQLRVYEPKDLSRQQYLEQQQRLKTTGAPRQ